VRASPGPGPAAAAVVVRQGRAVADLRHAQRTPAAASAAAPAQTGKMETIVAFFFELLSEHKYTGSRHRRLEYFIPRHDDGREKNCQAFIF
jgi:hypothetical protein